MKINKQKPYLSQSWEGLWKTSHVLPLIVNDLKQEET